MFLKRNARRLKKNTEVRVLHRRSEPVGQYRPAGTGKSAEGISVEKKTVRLKG
jgi:hypothetical protein